MMRTKRSRLGLLPGLIAALLLLGGLPGAADAKSRHHRHGHHHDRHHAHRGDWHGDWHGHRAREAAWRHTRHHRPHEARLYACRHCHHGFVSLHALYDHAHAHHGLAVVGPPSVVIQTSFGWVFGR